MKWINPSKVIHDIASHTLGMVTMIVRPPMSFPLSLSLARCPSETTSHMYAYVCQPKQRPKFGCYLKQPAESGPTDLLEDFFFFNSECSLSMAVSHRVQVAGVMARGWRLHEKNVYHVFFLGAWLISYWYIMFWMVGMNYDVTSQSHALRLEHTWITALVAGWDHLQLSGEGQFSWWFHKSGKHTKMVV